MIEACQQQPVGTTNGREWPSCAAGTLKLHTHTVFEFKNKILILADFETPFMLSVPKIATMKARSGVEIR